jgi:uncharacterized coiled-coil DUF342 family protein
MFFKRKKKGMPVPIEEVQRLTRSGLGDRDIIKELKNQGYSYEEIEKAMLQAVKAGVGEEEKPMEKKEEMESMIERYEEEPSGGPIGELPVLGELYPTERGEAVSEIALPETEKPELIIEELVEGVVEEKWERFSEEINRINDKFDKIRVGFEQLKQKTVEEKEPGKDFGGEITELSKRLDDLEVRIGGLEKAFKQFLPALTRNIESLSGMVHEMKRKG